MKYLLAMIFSLFVWAANAQSGVYIEQVGDGNMTLITQTGDTQSSSIIMPASNNNSIAIVQTGSSANVFTVTGTGINNNVLALQTGNAGANKNFQLNLFNANSADVAIIQTNPVVANTGSMSITCVTTCAPGTYSYVRR